GKSYTVLPAPSMAWSSPTRIPWIRSRIDSRERMSGMGGSPCSVRSSAMRRGRIPTHPSSRARLSYANGGSIRVSLPQMVRPALDPFLELAAQEAFRARQQDHDDDQERQRVLELDRHVASGQALRHAEDEAAQDSPRQAVEAAQDRGGEALEERVEHEE